ncbi:MAG: restriction endonuclease [Chloroflexota bacterium]|nr:restriction endonuclease [Chloroflexota bacterium]MDE2931388.1 restriction endonuclease [Chloroflexota bacterium]
MARISNYKGRRAGGYERLFGDVELGILISRIQGAVIGSGTELERIIRSRVKLIDDLDRFLKLEIMPAGIFLADKRQLKACKTLDFAGSEPDFVLFRRRDGHQHCYVVELKDGDNFDTKKAAAERRSMSDFISMNAQYVPYTMSAHICCFNQDSREEIVVGLKSKITLEEAMTGREFCELLEINYGEIIEERKADQYPNLSYFVEELLRIDAVKTLIEERLDSQDSGR